MKLLSNLNLAKQRVLIRVDFNVPLNKETKELKDDTRIREALPTIKYCLEQGAKVILVSHLGRPKGEIKEELRLEPVAKKLEQLLGRQVEYLRELGPGTTNLVLLENIRFWPGEEKNDPELAKQLAGLADVYINDAFGTAHRAHASTEGVAHLLPHAAGLLMQKEVENLTKLLHNPSKPFVALIGGAKISTKIGLLKNLLPKVDYLLLGGALANTVLLAQNQEVGESLVEKELAPTIADLLSNKLKVPVDVVVHDQSSKAIGTINKADKIFDIGPDTVNLYKEIIKTAKTIVWNGPVGLFEEPPFDQGTLKIAQAVAESGAYSVVGGGETVEALEKMGLKDKASFVSTGGGVMLEFLEGKNLPGIKALE